MNTAIFFIGYFIVSFIPLFFDVCFGISKKIIKACDTEMEIRNNAWLFQLILFVLWPLYYYVCFSTARCWFSYFFQNLHFFADKNNFSFQFDVFTVTDEDQDIGTGYELKLPFCSFTLEKIDFDFEQELALKL